MKILKIALFFVLSLYSAQQNFVCVTIAIKNNESTIWDCLKSASEIADCFSICDLGSTDGTKRRVEEFLTSYGIPGKIYPREVTNPVLQTQILTQAAQKTIKSLGYPPTNTYLCFLEPDQKISNPLAPIQEELKEDTYMILEKSEFLSCYIYKPNFMKASLSAETIQAMRESNGSMWKTIPRIKKILLEDQMNPIFDDADLTEEERKKLYLKKIEEIKQEKIQQQIDWYSEACNKDPENTKYLLFLAQSYKSLKQYDQAISHFQSRIGRGGDSEELWFAKYMIGECYEDLGQWLQALYWYLEAYETNPNRAESIRKIATYYRLHGKNEIAYLFAKHGWKIPKEDTHNLFPSSPLYDYQFDEEISVAAYYTKFKEEGYIASSDLILRKDTPEYIKDQGYLNLLFYVQPLNGRYEPIRIPLPLIHDDTDQTYSPMNPSILKTDDGYVLICRAVNYTQIGAKHFSTLDKQGIFRTKNFLIHYDKKFHKIYHQEILEDLPREKHKSFIIEGLEDCRLIDFENHSWFSCTTFDTSPTGAIQISLCKMGFSEKNEPIQVEKLTPLKGPDPNRHEKNWLPFVKEGEIHFIYSSDPFTLYKPNLITGACETVYQYTPEHDFRRFRGSAAPIPFDDGYLMLVHEVVYMPDYTRTYLHRFVYLDKNFIAKKTSKPFVFIHKGIEFCLSMTLDHDQKQLILPIGIEDKEAYLFFADLDYVRSLFLDLPKIYNPF
jgi:tetratricopeptide (TPR) repeat protein